MNIPQLPEGSPIPWLVEYQDGTRVSSAEGTWLPLVGQPELHDGQILFCAKRPAKWLQVTLPGEDHLTLHLEGLPCFAQARFAACLGDVNGNGETQSAIWLATAFGYLLPESAVVLLVTATSSHLFTLPRPFSLPW